MVEAPARITALLRRLEVLPLGTVLSLERPLRLPRFPGALLHAALGNALQRVACLRPAGERCPGRCARPAECAFALLFEGSSPSPGPWMRRQARRPLPLILRLPHRTAPRELAFGLVLVGRAATLAPLVTAALEAMAALGLGRNRAPGQVRRLYQEEADAGTRELYRPERGLVAAPRAWSLPWEAPAGEATVRLRFRAPLRLVVRSRIQRRPRFVDLVLALERRLTSLAVLYGPDPEPPGPDPEVRRLAAAAEAVWEESRWENFTRFSSRQGRTVRLGGVLGTLRVTGPVGPLVPLLRAGEILHVGKGISFGFGRYELFREVPA